MFDISLHILDIAENSIKAHASRILISLISNTRKNLLILRVIDNGTGIMESMQENILSPYCTSRTERNIGMGLPLLSQACAETGGHLALRSKMGKGTALRAVFILNHIDRLPIGDLGKTILMLMVGNQDVEFKFKVFMDDNRICFSSPQVKELLGIETFVRAGNITKLKAF